MRQFALKSERAFRVGLRPNSKMQPNTEHMSAVFGLVPRQYGLESPAAITRIVLSEGDNSTGLLDEYILGWPNIYSFHERTADDFRVHRLDREAGAVLLDDNIKAVKYVDGTAVDTVVSGDSYSADISVDLTGPLCYSVTKDSVAVCSDNTWMLLLPWGYFAMPKDQTADIACIAEHKNRLFYGGIKEGGAWTDTDEFKALLRLASLYTDQYNQYNSSSYSLSNDGDLVFFGMEGGGSSDCPYALEMCFLTGYKYDELRTLVEDALRARLMGVIRLTDGGGVVALKSLANRVIAYGDQNLWSLELDESGGYKDKHIDELNVFSRAAVAGNRNKHVFVTREGCIYKLMNEYLPIKVDMEEYIFPLLTDEGMFKVVFDGYKGDFYFSYVLLGENATQEAYILTKEGGFAQSRIVPWSIIRRSSGLCGSVANTETTACYFTFQIRDDNRNALKTIETLEITRRGGTAWKCQVGTNEDVRSPSMKKGRLEPFNFQDVAYPITEGINYEITVFVTDSNRDIICSGMRTKWKGNDLRAIRGLTEQATNEPGPTADGGPEVSN